MAASASAAWVVECACYTLGPFASEETAKRNLAAVVSLGACMFDHEVRRL